MSDLVNRIDTASRMINASPEAVYRAFLEPQTLAKWLPPEGMTGHVSEFHAQEGGTIRMTLTYVDPHPATGKSTDNTDIFQGTFLELIPHKRIVLRIEFESEDPSYAGAMIMNWSLKEVSEGTQVNIDCQNVPVGIEQDVHEQGLRSTLAGLAALLE